MTVSLYNKNGTQQKEIFEKGYRPYSRLKRDKGPMEVGKSSGSVSRRIWYS